MNSILVLLYIGVFAICLLSLFAVIYASKKYHLFIDSNLSSKPQRFHSTPTARAGGLGIMLGSIFGITAILGLDMYWWFFMVGGFVIFLSGFAEDCGYTLSPKLRLILQCIGVCIALVGMDIWIKSLGLGFEFSYVIGLIFSVFAVVGVCNAINIIDGFNGLSGGIVLIVCLSLLVVLFQADILEIFYLTLIFGCATLGFLVLNFPRGRIFLGDGGAYFLGFAFGVIFIILTQTNNSIVSPWYGFCVMVYPIWEVLFSIGRKKLSNKQAMQPDGLHLHMLLYKKLRNNPLTSLIIVCANIPFVALATLFYPNTFVLIITSLVFIVVYSLIYFRLLR